MAYADCTLKGRDLSVEYIVFPASPSVGLLREVEVMGAQDMDGVKVPLTATEVEDVEQSEVGRAIRDDVGFPLVGDLERRTHPLP